MWIVSSANAKASVKKKEKNKFYICPESWNLNIHEFLNSKNFPFIFSLEKLV